KICGSPEYCTPAIHATNTNDPPKATTATGCKAPVNRCQPACKNVRARFIAPPEAGGRICPLNGRFFWNGMGVRVGAGEVVGRGGGPCGRPPCPKSYASSGLSIKGSESEGVP